MSATDMSLQELNQQLKQSLKAMKDSLRVVESAKKPNFTKSFIQQDRGNNYLDLILANDQLTAKTSILEQEVMSLKSQLAAAKLSHQEAETVYNKVVNVRDVHISM